MPERLSEPHDRSGTVAESACYGSGKLIVSAAGAKKGNMTLDEAIQVVRTHIGRMNELYGRTVFDEWAIVVILGEKGRVLHYEGNRREDFRRNFAQDAQYFASELRDPGQHLGDFSFARHGTGTRFDAYLIVGEGLYVLSNNTASSMSEISQDPRWLSAQVPFVEMSDRFRSEPLVYPM